MWSGKQKTYFTGRRCIAEMYLKFTELGELSASDPEFGSHGFIIALYQVFFEQYHQYLGHYFRHLYHIVKYIDNEKLKR
jgi:hypothetical protein